MTAHPHAHGLVDVYDGLRAIVISGLIFMGSALIYYYVWSYFRGKKANGKKMALGSLSAVCLILPAIFNQAAKFGAGISWRLPFYAAAAVFGILAIQAKGDE